MTERAKGPGWGSANLLDEAAEFLPTPDFELLRLAQKEVQTFEDERKLAQQIKDAMANELIDQEQSIRSAHDEYAEREEG